MEDAWLQLGLPSPALRSIFALAHFPLPSTLPTPLNHGSASSQELVAERASARLPRPRAQLLILARSPQPPLPREAIYHQLRGHGRGPAAHRRFYAAIKTI